MANLFQSILMGDAKRANWVLSHFPENFWYKIGRRRALSTYKLAFEKVPAYSDFLKINSLNNKKIDFRNLPISNKVNYLQKYPFHERLIEGREGLQNIHAFSKSSGSSGKPTYWPRFGVSDKTTISILAFVYDYLFQIFEKPTLIINNLALGTWTAGELAGDASRKVSSLKNCKASVISPGANSEETAEAIKDLSPFYEQIISIAYPPFAKHLLNDLEDINVNLNNINLKFMLGGEGFSEHYRDYLYSRLNTNHLNTVIGIYASSDAGFIGSESPLSIFIKRKANKNPKLAEDLFGTRNINQMTLIQYNPIGRYFEAIDKELVITVYQAAPLVRYNTHDLGGLIKFQTVLSICSKHNFFPLKNLSSEGFKYVWKLPFLYALGRSDDTISIGGANIYPENIMSGLKKFNEVSSFKLSSSLDENNNTKFDIYIELDKKHQLNDSDLIRFKEKLHSIILDALLKLNEDFRDAYRLDPSSLDPEIKIFKFGEGPFRIKDIKHKYTYSQ